MGNMVIREYETAETLDLRIVSLSNPKYVISVCKSATRSYSGTSPNQSTTQDVWEIWKTSLPDDNPYRMTYKSDNFLFPWLFPPGSSEPSHSLVVRS